MTLLVSLVAMPVCADAVDGPPRSDCPPGTLADRHEGTCTVHACPAQGCGADWECREVLLCVTPGINGQTGDPEDHAEHECSSDGRCVDGGDCRHVRACVRSRSFAGCAVERRASIAPWATIALVVSAGFASRRRKARTLRPPRRLLEATALLTPRRSARGTRRGTPPARSTAPYARSRARGHGRVRPPDRAPTDPRAPPSPRS